MISTSILILHYADEAMTDNCVNSLMQQTTQYDAQIVVIDNASPIPYRRGDVEVLRTDKNYPIIPALAIGMRQFPAAIYGLLNNDLICAPGMVDTVLSCFDDPDVGIVAPGSSDGNTGILYVPFPDQWGNLETEQVDNHCIWISHELVEAIGYPETDGHTHRAVWGWNKLYCWKARKAGFKIVAARNAYVEHLGGQYDAAADQAGREWLMSRLGERVGEAW